jgi:hypothetical protein
MNHRAGEKTDTERMTTTAAPTTTKRPLLFAGVKVWFSPNLLISDLSLRDELERRGATIVEHAGGEPTTNTTNNNNNNNINSHSKSMILHIVASSSDSVSTQANMRNNKLATVHYVRALIEQDNATNTNLTLSLPTEWDGNLLASLAMRGLVVCCTGMAAEEKTVSLIRGISLCWCDHFVWFVCLAIASYCVCVGWHCGAHFG